MELAEGQACVLCTQVTIVRIDGGLVRASSENCLNLCEMSPKCCNAVKGEEIVIRNSKAGPFSREQQQCGNKSLLYKLLR